MKIRSLKIFSLLILSLLCLTSFAQDKVPDEIKTSLKTGNSKMLSEYFSQKVELVILENDNVYSKAQAQQIIGKFFTTCQPEKFEVLHSSKNEPKYVIGTLTTKQGNFRVYFLLKQDSGKTYIHQLRIEKQN